MVKRLFLLLSACILPLFGFTSQTVNAYTNETPRISQNNGYQTGDNSGTIAFTSDVSGNNEIYIMDADGSHVSNITQNPSRDGEPAWSPKGDKIAFVSNREGDAQIYTMNPDGTNVKRVTHDVAADISPAWSPDGQQLIFMTFRNHR